MSNKSERTDYVVHDSQHLATARWTKSFTARSLAEAYAHKARPYADHGVVTITTVRGMR